MTHLFLQPVDVWLFRDGRPFDPGSGRRAESLFPPYPTVIQGAIRSKHLTIKGVSLSDKQKIEATVGTSLDFTGKTVLKGLSLRGPFLARRENGKITRYFPQPADAFSVNKDKHTLRPASPPEEKPAGVETSLLDDLWLLGFVDELKKGEEGLWISQEALLQYLVGIEVTGTQASTLFERENRLGIGMDNVKQTTKEGMLYEVEFIRPCRDVGLLVEMNGYNGWPEEGLLQVGGESRAAIYNREENVHPWPAIPNPLPKHFKVYFATPTFFNGGWKPNDWHDFFTGNVILRAAALNRYQSVGGFDWAANSSDSRAHRASRRFVPAGSVYYFDWKGDQPPTLKSGTITHFGAEIGFGQIIISGKEW